MNDAIAPFNDVNVRKALNLAIDRDYIFFLQTMRSPGTHSLIM